MDNNIKYIRRENLRCSPLSPCDGVIAMGYVMSEKNISSHKVLIDEIDLGAAVTLLDVGFGFGRDIKKIHRKYPEIEIYGCDRQEYFIKQGDIPATLLKADAAKLPFADKAFDLVIANALMCELSKTDAIDALSELTRVGKKVLYTELLQDLQTFEVITICS